MDKRWRRWIVLFAALALFATACGTEGDDGGGGGAEDTDTAEATGSEATGSESGGGGDAAVPEGEVEVASGTTVDFADCPSDWSNTNGITDSEIRLAISLPESGPIAALGEIDDGMRAYFNFVNENEPIADREIVLISADDAYDPARTLTNVEDQLATENVFAYTYLIGTPNNLAVRDLLDEECVPQLFNSTGFPGWGNPSEYPWTIGGLLSYQTEARIWCNYVAEELGEGASVAALFMNNDFGQAYRDEVEACAEEGVIDLVESVSHEPAAPDVTDDITTLAASDAEAVMLGTTGAPCPQAMSALAGSSWDPMTILSNTCQTISTYFKPIDPAGEGVLVAVNSKTAGDPQYSDDEAVQQAVTILQDAGLDPFSGSSFIGTIFGHTVVNHLRAAAEMENGLTRLNFLEAVWNADEVNPLALDGLTEQTDGVNDAYLIEGARMAEYVPPGEGEETGSYEFLGDLLNLEGETGSVSQDG